MPALIRFADRDDACREALRDELEEILQPMLSSDEKPSLSVEYLVLISVVFLAKTDPHTALGWVLRSFQYYNDISINHITAEDPPSYDVTYFKRDFLASFRRLDLPLEKSTSPHSRNYSTATSEARLCLAPVLNRSEPESMKKPFRLMDLPAEIRVQIYEYALSFPRTGVNIVKGFDGQHQAVTKTIDRSYDSDAPAEEWMNVLNVWQRRNDSLVGPPLGSFLSLLCVSKKVHKESLPVFYKINTFVCGNINELHDLLRYTSPDRRSHIRHLISRYNARDDSDKLTTAKALQCVKMLANMKGLQQLELVFQEEEFMSLMVRKAPKYASRLDIPGVKILGQMRGLKKVNFPGDCDTVRSFLEVEMCKPNPEEEESSGPKKKGRKRKAAGEAGGKPKRRVGVKTTA